MSSDLQPLSPAEAREMYLEDRADSVRDATLQAHHYRTKAFVKFCDAHGIDNLNDLTGRDLHAFKRERGEDLAATSLQSQLSTLRQFLRFCRDIDGVPSGLPEKVRPPTPEDTSRDTRVTGEQAEAILDRLSKFDYASRDHALFLTAWHTAARIGGLRALDLGHVHLDDPEQPHLQYRHSEATPLKNGSDGQRDVAISDGVARVLRDYIDERRVSQTVDGREPLFTTNHGRISEGWLRRTMYKVTRPCWTGTCPHDRDPDDCEAVQNREKIASCPSARPPHDVRRGSMSDHLQRGWPIEQLSERVDATPRVIRKHYDVREARESMLTRSALLDDHDRDMTQGNSERSENRREDISDRSDVGLISDGSVRI